MIENKTDSIGLCTVTFGENVVEGLRKYRSFTLTSTTNGKSYQGTIDNAGIIVSKDDIPIEAQAFIIKEAIKSLISSNPIV